MKDLVEEVRVEPSGRDEVAENPAQDAPDTVAVAGLP